MLDENHSRHRTKASVYEVNVENFDILVRAASREKPVLVDFWAKWCTPCLVLAPVLERVAHDYSELLRVAKIEVDAGENMRLAGHYRVRGFPTVILFAHGESVARFSGARPYHWIETFVKEHCCSESFV